MGRWKGSPQGPYWDAADSGPNQVDPPPGASPNGPQAQQPQQQAPQPIGQDGFQLPPWLQTMPDAGPGGMTGKGIPGDVQVWSESGMGQRQAPPPDLSQWPRKQYPGGLGGPVQPGGPGDVGDLSSLAQQAGGGGGSVSGGPLSALAGLSGHGSLGAGTLLGGGGTGTGMVGRLIPALGPAGEPLQQPGVTLGSRIGGGAFNSLMHSPYGVKR